jgi:hypothetical protein
MDWQTLGAVGIGACAGSVIGGKPFWRLLAALRQHVVSSWPTAKYRLWEVAGWGMAPGVWLLTRTVRALAFAGLPYHLPREILVRWICLFLLLEPQQPAAPQEGRE